MHYEYCKEKNIGIVRVAINDKGQGWDFDDSPVKKLGNHGLLTINGISPVPVSDPIPEGGGGAGESLADFWLHITQLKKSNSMQKRLLE